MRMAAETRTILVVEDEFASLEVLEMFLQAKGYRVVTASDGEAALALLEEARVDLVLTDYMMPRMNGIELCRQMRQREALRTIPVILMSATYRADIPRDPQIVAYFGKPIQIGKLLDKVRELLDAAP